MLITTEAKAQGWRAVAVFSTGEEALLFVGRSSTQVRGGYVEAFKEVLKSDEQVLISTIKLQQWQGAPDAGKWQDKGELRLPTQTKQTARVAA
jgi:hypothetical protein